MNADFGVILQNFLPRVEDCAFILSVAEGQTVIVHLSQATFNERLLALYERRIFKVAKETNDSSLKVYEKYAETLRSLKSLEDYNIQPLNAEEYDQEFEHIYKIILLEKEKSNLTAVKDSEAESIDNNLTVVNSNPKSKSGTVFSYSFALKKDEILQQILESNDEEMQEEKRIAKEEQKTADIKKSEIEKSIRKHEILIEESLRSST